MALRELAQKAGASRRLLLSLGPALSQSDCRLLSSGAGEEFLPRCGQAVAPTAGSLPLASFSPRRRCSSIPELPRTSTVELTSTTVSSRFSPRFLHRSALQWYSDGSAASVESQSQRREGSAAAGSERGILCSSGLRSVAYVAAAVVAASASTVAAKQIPLKPIPESVVLYQYEACPFCNKVKAYLDYHSIPYEVVEVNPLTRKEIKWSGYKKVPILVVDGETLVDSSAIISTLQERLNPSTLTTSTEEENKVEEDKWRQWVDKHLVHLLSPNIYRTPTEALEAFDYIATNGNFGTLERAMARYVGASTMYFIGKKLKKKHNIDDERQSLYAALNEWTAAVGSRKFLGGDKPNLADLAVFGVLRPIRQMQTGRDMMENTGVGKWYSDMENEVGTSERLPDKK